MVDPLSRTVGKITRVLRSPDRGYRIIGALNKSPIRFLVRMSINLAYSQVRKKRKEAIRLDRSRFERRLADLKINGFCSFDVEPEILARLLEHGQQKLTQTEALKQSQITKAKESVWVRLSDKDRLENKLDSNHPLVAFALQEPLLALAGCYLDEPALLSYVVLTLSNPMKGLPEASQLWHFDRDDVAMLKVFVYLTDVDSEKDGPFTLLDAVVSKGARTGFFMKHLTEQELLPTIDLSKVHRMTGKKGTCFLVDTSRCLHMGSRVSENHSRLMYTGLFTGAPCIHPPGKNRIRFNSSAELSPMQKLALQL